MQDVVKFKLAPLAVLTESSIGNIGVDEIDTPVDTSGKIVFNFNFKFLVESIVAPDVNRTDAWPFESVVNVPVKLAPPMFADSTPVIV